MELPLGNGDTPLEWLRARAILVDMEEGVLNETLNGPLGELFDGRQLIKDVSGVETIGHTATVCTGHNTTIEYTKPSDRPRNFVTAYNLFHPFARRWDRKWLRDLHFENVGRRFPRRIPLYNRGHTLTQ